MNPNAGTCLKPLEIESCQSCTPTRAEEQSTRSCAACRASRIWTRPYQSAPRPPRAAPPTPESLDSRSVQVRLTAAPSLAWRLPRTLWRSLCLPGRPAEAGEGTGRSRFCLQVVGKWLCRKGPTPYLCLCRIQCQCQEKESLTKLRP